MTVTKKIIVAWGGAVGGVWGWGLEKAYSPAWLTPDAIGSSLCRVAVVLIIGLTFFVNPQTITVR